MLRTEEIIAIFSTFFYFRNKPRNAGRSRKNSVNSPKCGISRTIAGRLTPMQSKRLQAGWVDRLWSSMFCRWSYIEPPLPVTSGVPQGTVLGPALFLCYINSMPEGISSSIRLFADDTGVYRQITSAADHAILQQYLHKLARWEAECSMEFHPHKCNVLKVTRSRSPSIFNYTLHGTTLKSTENTKYLGVTLTKDLTWGKHVDNIRAKANKQLAFVRRT